MVPGRGSARVDALSQREPLLEPFADAHARDARLALELDNLSWVGERTSNAVIITGPHGRIECVNRGFTELTEWQTVEVAAG